MATTNITIKLLIDTKANKVLFAEASKGFVDLLFFLLSLPIGTVIKLLTSQSMAGSIGNLYTSFANLNEMYLQPNLNKNILLDPKFSTSVTNIPLSITGSSTNSRKFFACATENCRRHDCAISDECNAAKCPCCKNCMSKEVKFIAASNSTKNKDLDGFVQKMVSYMISDDLSVTSMSMISGISMINKVNVSKLDLLEERSVEVDTEKGLELLKASLQSTTVLTDVFLGKIKGKPAI